MVGTHTHPTAPTLTKQTHALFGQMMIFVAGAADNWTQKRIERVYGRAVGAQHLQLRLCRADISIELREDLLRLLVSRIGLYRSNLLQGIKARAREGNKFTFARQHATKHFPAAQQVFAPPIKQPITEFGIARLP